MKKLPYYAHVTAVAIIAAACQTTVNLGDVSDTSKLTESTASSAGESDATTDPKTTDGSTGTPETTGKPDSTGGTTGTGDTTDKPESTTDTTGGTMDTTGVGDTDSSTTTTTTGGMSTGGMSTMGSTTSDGSTTGGEMAMLGAWTRYREVLIDNGLNVDLKDYQVLIKVDYDSDMLPDYADLRFTDELGNELLPYWVELDTGPVYALAWVRIPLIAADGFTTIRMYYGNQNANPGSDGFSTFLFFDDFEAGQLDATKWKATASPSVALGRLSITQGAVYTAKPAASFQDTRVEARVLFKNQAGAPNSVVMASQGQVNGPGLMHAFRSTNVCQLFDSVKTVYNMSCSNGDNDMTKLFGIGAFSGSYYFHTNRALVPTIVDSNLAYSYYLNLGHVFGKAADLNDTQDMDVDWVLVRRMAKTDPATFVGGEKNP